MCARITLSTAAVNRLLQQFAVEEAAIADYRPRYNIKPGEKEAQVLAVRLIDGKRRMARLHWPLVPFFEKTKKLKYSTVNARADRVATSPAYRASYKRRRCLVLADHYIEFETVGKAKLPWLYSVDDGQPFAIAGLWDLWRDPDQPDAPPYESCTLLTTTPNDLTSAINHERMPVILDEADYGAWLNCEEIPLVPFPADRMSARRTSTYINDVRHEGPECLSQPREHGLL
jgi:putative SOS response-associated peptidase YedK